MPLTALRDLELRYDGPVPPQHFLTAQGTRRRRRGTITVLETQAARFIDAATRCEGDIEDLSADLADRDYARWQRESLEARVAAVRAQLTAHVDAAAAALAEAAGLRIQLDMPLHPVLAVLARLSARAAP